MALKLVLAFTGFGEGKEVAGPEEPPRAFSFRPTRDTGVVFIKSTGNVIGEADVVFSSDVLEHVNLIVQGEPGGLVAGVGFEPTTFRL